MLAGQTKFECKVREYSWQLAVGSWQWQWAVGGWQLAVGSGQFKREMIIIFLKSR